MFLQSGFLVAANNTHQCLYHLQNITEVIIAGNVLNQLKRQTNHLTVVEFYTVVMLLTVILIIIIISLSPPHSFIPDLKPPFSANPSHRSPSFSSSGLNIHGFPGLFTVTSEHIHFLLFKVFFCFTLFSCRFRAVN